MKKLDEAAFRKTSGGSGMIRVKINEGPPFDFWPYVEAIPEEDFNGYDCSEGRVEWVWRSEDSRFEHVLISTAEDVNVFMAVVLDRTHSVVVGHRLLDLNTEYGVAGDEPRQAEQTTEAN
ncbi:hypothetical protein [Roseibacillus ishigakijimensis]|uniref:Uncharacterized protein n=1 Tax=Roseibacillus ishigakijimensis TaxID=454146 RepID=A0A934VM67_9BACT|nr:hypothetical protein [Roseibacillus ishigakijimensis]MBK1833957.1 hypothetical protein [Roseibacillus ishigakijimensis]